MAGTAPSSGDCTAYWKLEDLTDATGNGHTLTNNGATGGATGKINDGRSTDGTNDNFYTTTDVFTEVCSICMWVRGADLSQTTKRIMDENGASGVHFDVTNTDKITMSAYDGTNTRTRETGTLLDDTYYHLVIAWDTSNIDFYIDGSAIGSTQTFNGLPITYRNGIVFGSRRTALGDRNFGGIFDEICIFDVKLTADNVTYLYNGGNPGSAQQYPFAAPTGNISKVLGVSWDNIAKINGITKANIAKLNGVSA